jgi:hypothetical protein
VPIQKRHTKQIYTGNRQGKLRALNRPGQARTVAAHPAIAREPFSFAPPPSNLPAVQLCFHQLQKMWPVRQTERALHQYSKGQQQAKITVGTFNRSFCC